MIVIKLPDGTKISLTPEQWEKVRRTCKHDAYCELHNLSHLKKKPGLWERCKKSFLHIGFSLLLMTAFFFLYTWHGFDYATQSLVTLGTLYAAFFAYRGIER